MDGYLYAIVLIPAMSELLRRSRGALPAAYDQQ